MPGLTFRRKRGGWRWLDPGGFQSEGQTWSRSPASAVGFCKAGRALLRCLGLRDRGETEAGAQGIYVGAGSYRGDSRGVRDFLSLPGDHRSGWVCRKAAEACIECV